MCGIALMKLLKNYKNVMTQLYKYLKKEGES